MAMDNNQNQFGYVENSGMGIAGYEDCKESPQRNNPPMDTRTNKEDKPREENRKNSVPRKEGQDDGVLIFIPQEEKKERRTTNDLSELAEILDILEYDIYIHKRG